MSKKYVCDVCQKVIENPYMVVMREFYIDWHYHDAAPSENRRKWKRVHLCKYCLQKLREIAEKAHTTEG